MTQTSHSSSMTRRAFVRNAAAGVSALALTRQILAQAAPEARPNILWIVSEDNNPYLGCYGNKLVHTPTLDRLASEGILYENCFSAAPVCAPTRFSIITGVYASSCSPANHMRAQGKIPPSFRGFPAYLRQAGYYTTNNAKTDYNAPIKMNDAWDASGRQAHWRNRPAGKPFFAIFNHEVTHESRVFPKSMANLKPVAQPVDPAKVDLPAYHPDTPEFRRDRANYYDHMSRLDDQVAKLLKQLEDDGLAENTIIFYYGDNGGVLGRSKRFCFDSGLHVPLIVRFPKKWQHLAPAAPGSRIQAPACLVDMGPSVLSLANVPIPQHMEGQALLGSAKAPDRQYAFSFRNRMDERYDFVRTARDSRYRYIRNYMPHLIYGQNVQYMFQQKSVQVWEQLYKQGKLTGPQKFFWEEKPAEELYDLATDPSEVKNLVESPEHQEILKRMRAALDQHMLRTRDNGFIPEGSELEGYANTRDQKAYPLARLMEIASTATERDPANLSKLIGWMSDENECVRYWATLGCVMLRAKAAPAAEALAKRLADASGPVRVTAAEALCHLGQTDKGLPVLQDCLTNHQSPSTRLQAANALQNIGEKARPALAALEKATDDQNDYVKRATRYTVSVLKGLPAPTEQ